MNYFIKYYNMLFQDTFNWYNFLADIIGSIVATISAILIWFFIEWYKKRREHRNLEKSLNKLYNAFSINDFTISTPAEVFNIIMNEIGEENLLKVLKMKIRSKGTGYVVEGYPFFISIVFTQQSYTLLIRRYEVNFRYKNPDQNPGVLIEFLKYFSEQCKKENITIQ